MLDKKLVIQYCDEEIDKYNQWIDNIENNHAKMHSAEDFRGYVELQKLEAQIVALNNLKAAIQDGGLDITA